MVKCKDAARLCCESVQQKVKPVLILYTVMCTLSLSNFSQANDAASGGWQAVGAAPQGGTTSGEGWFRTGSNQGAGDAPHVRQPQTRQPPIRVTRPGSVVPVITATENHRAEINTVGNNTKQNNSTEVITTEDNTIEFKQPVPDTSTQKVDLFVGEVRVLGEFDARRVAVGNGAIVSAEILDSGELLIIATSAGSTSVRLWSRDESQTDYNIRVSESDPETRVHMQRMVRMRVRMVEFRKSALGSLGIDWSDSTSGPTFGVEGDASFDGRLNTVTPFSASFGIASNITSRINFLAQNGDAVTLAEPVLSAINGGEASFLAGGEVPYPTIGENGQTQIEFKEYGVKLNVAPLIDGAGNVHARLETEISQLDSSVTVQGAPGLLTRRAQTEVTVRSGETIVISGLLSTESSADTEMIPGLGRLPVIGRLFRSKNKRNTVNELVIFVTPEVVEPHDAMINTREQQYLRESDKRMSMVRRQLPLME